MVAVNAVKIGVVDPQAKANNTMEQPVKIKQIQPQQAVVNTSPGVMKVGDIPVSNEKMPAQYAQYALLARPGRDGKPVMQMVKVAVPPPTLKTRAVPRQAVPPQAVAKPAPQAMVKGKDGKPRIFAKIADAFAPKASGLGAASGFAPYAPTGTYGPTAAIPDIASAAWFRDPNMFNTTDMYSGLSNMSSGGYDAGWTDLTSPYVYAPIPGNYPGDIYA